MTDMGDRYELDFAAPLDWATLVDRAAETGCVDEMLDLQAMFNIRNDRFRGNASEKDIMGMDHRPEPTGGNMT